MVFWFFELCVSMEPDITADRRIIGGREATNVPWIVTLNENGHGHFCAGSIIHEKWVLTARHCVKNVNPSDFYVQGGVHDLTDSSGVQDRDVKAIYIPSSSRNDIGLIELE